MKQATELIVQQEIPVEDNDIVPPEGGEPLRAANGQHLAVHETMLGWRRDCAGFVTHMEVGALSPEAARELAAVSTPGGRLPEEVLEYVVAQSEGICLNIEQMSVACSGGAIRSGASAETGAGGRGSSLASPRRQLCVRPCVHGAQRQSCRGGRGRKPCSILGAARLRAPHAC